MTRSMSIPTGHAKKTLGVFGFLAIAIGLMLGVGWITVVGTWLKVAGPAGTIAGLGLGAVLMTGVAACYAELAGMLPLSGGEVNYAFEAFGSSAAFVVGWFLLFVAISILSFEALSLAWVLETLVPALQVSPLFQFLGVPVTGPQLIIAQASLWTIYMVNRSGLHTSAQTQKMLTAIKVIILIGFILGGFFLAQPGRALQFAPNLTPIQQVSRTLWIFATSAYWFGGFIVIAQLAGDRSPQTTMNTVGKLMVGTIGIAVVFYAGIVFASAAAAPLEATINAQLPAAFAAKSIFKSVWGSHAILCAGIAGILATMNAMLLSASRVLLVFGEIRAMRRNDTAKLRGSGKHKFALIIAISSIGAFAGRGLLIPLVNSGAMAMIVCYFFMCLAALKLRLSDPGRERPFTVVGGVPMLATIVAAIGCTGIFLLIEPVLNAPEWPPLEWVILGGWAIFGILVWVHLARSPRPAAL